METGRNSAGQLDILVYNVCFIEQIVQLRSTASMMNVSFVLVLFDRGVMTMMVMVVMIFFLDRGDRDDWWGLVLFDVKSLQLPG